MRYYKVTIGALVLADDETMADDLERDCFSVNADRNPSVAELTYKVTDVQPMSQATYLQAERALFGDATEQGESSQ